MRIFFLVLNGEDGGCKDHVPFEPVSTFITLGKGCCLQQKERQFVITQRRWSSSRKLPVLDILHRLANHLANELANNLAHYLAHYLVNNLANHYSSDWIEPWFYQYLEDKAQY